MLIPQRVKDAVQTGKLVAYEPFASWVGEPRCLFMCEAIRKDIEEARDNPDEKTRQCWAKVEAAFSHFVEGGFISSNRLKQLQDYKHEHWEFRCIAPKPSIRVFGRFLMPDVFVATHSAFRKKLGAMWSPEFEHEKLVCEEHWNNAGLTAFFSAPPTYDYERYITENAQRRLLI